MNLDKRLLRLALESRLALATTLVLGLAAGVLTVVQARLLSRVVAAGFLEAAGWPLLAPWMGTLMLIILGRAAIAWGSEVAGHAAAARLKSALRNALYRHILTLGPAFLRKQRSGELVTTALEGIEALEPYFSQYLPSLALAALVPLTFLLAVFPLDPLSGVVLLVTAPLIPLFMVLIGNMARRLTQRQWQTLGRMGAYFLDVLQGLTTLKWLGRSREQAQVLWQVSDRFRVVTMKVLRVTFLSALVLEMVATLSTAVVAVQVGLRLLYGWLTFEQAFFVLLLAPEFYLPLRLLGARFHAGMAGTAAAQRLFAILEEIPSVPQGASATPPPSPPLGVTFRGVKVAYAEGRPALKGLDLDLPPGQRVALVGLSGSGKTTVASLLMRFDEPDEGVIQVNGIPLSKIPAESWRECLAYVSQQPYLFQDTVLENIRLGRPQATFEEVVAAAQQAGAHEFIERLPQGYKTRLGERGARLSRGQAQRIALARAFLKNAPLVILDEPTAHLDPQSEEQLLQALERLLNGRTALIIAHRLNSIARADHIVVLDQGRALARGKHSELLRTCSVYRELVRSYRGEGYRPQPVAPVEAHPWQPTSSQAELPLGFATLLPSSTARPSGEVPHLPWQVLGRLLRFLTPYWGGVGLSALAGAATTLSAVGLMGASAYIISAAALQPSIATLQVAIVGVRFFGIARGLARYFERYLSHQTTFRLLAQLRVWFYRAVEPLAPARLQAYRSGDLLSRLLGDIESLENFYVRVVAPPLSALLVGIALWFLLRAFLGEVALAWLGCWLLAGLGVPGFARWLGRGPGKTLVERRANLAATLVDGIQGLSEVVAFGRQSDWARGVARCDHALAQAQRRLAGISGLQSALSLFFAHGASWLTLWLGLSAVQSGALNGVYLAVLMLIVLSSFEALTPLPLAMQVLESNLQAARRLFEIADSPPAVTDPPHPLPPPSAFDIKVENLSFRYPEENGGAQDGGTTGAPWALQEVSFEVPFGKWIALVGPSGAGKTTFLNLLGRFWDYQEGQILLGGYDLRRYAQGEVRRALAIVPQEAYLFSATLEDNLRLANPQAGRQELEQAVRQAQLERFVATLPSGYATWVGEHGQQLSGGERQRLAIARALLKKAPILLLDEPTSGLDALTERAVLGAIFEAARGRTLILVTHRLVAMERMDEIVVLVGGRVVERGRHTELLAKGGVYRRLWQAQRRRIAE